MQIGHNAHMHKLHSSSYILVPHKSNKSVIRSNNCQDRQTDRHGCALHAGCCTCMIVEYEVIPLVSRLQQHLAFLGHSTHVNSLIFAIL